MIIEINKDIDRYQESVVFGLGIKQLVYSAISLVCGGGIVFLVYPYVGLTIAAYIAIPVVAPIAMSGFYSMNGMSFMEVTRRKMYYAFLNRGLPYESTEGTAELRAYKQQLLLEEKRKDKGKYGIIFRWLQGTKKG